MEQSVTDSGGSAQSAPKGVVFLDFDDALIRGSSWRLLHSQFDVVKEANDHYEQFDDGEIEFAEWGRLDAGLWEGFPASGITEAAADVDVVAGIQDATVTLSNAGYQVGVVSGGVKQFIKEVLEGVPLDFLIANEITIKDGVITGEVDMQVTSDGKTDIFEQLATEYNVTLEQTVAVGNSASDFQPDGRGLQIALNSSDDAARARSDVVIDSDSMGPVVDRVHDWESGS